LFLETKGAREHRSLGNSDIDHVTIHACKLNVMRLYILFVYVLIAFHIEQKNYVVSLWQSEAVSHPV
jgi:hypothetical protein